MLITEGAPGLALFETRVPRKSVNPNLLHFVVVNHLALAACSAAGLGLCLFLRGFQLFARKPAFGRFPRVVVGAANPGFALIVGSATGPRTLAAPITKKPCYLYRASIWQQPSVWQTEWKKVAEESGHLTFLVEDPTGQLLVEPLGAEIDLCQDFSQEYGSSSSSSETNVPEHVASFLARNGIVPDCPTRIEECCLQPASPVFVAGTLSESALATPLADSSCCQQVLKPPQREKNSSLAVPARHPEVIHLSSGAAPSSTLQMTQQAKIAAALSRAGLAQTDVWAPAEISVPTLSYTPVLVTEKTQLSPTPNPAPNSRPALTMMKGADDTTFVISNHRQFELPTPLGWKSTALVVAGSSLTVLGLCILLLRRLHGFQ